jgi:Xaa-Pro dipeptidase
VEADTLASGDLQLLGTCPAGPAPVDASLLLRLLRMRKSHAALDRMRTVAELTEQALVVVCREWEHAGPAALQQRYRMVLAAAGADVDHFVYGVPGGGVGLTVGRPALRNATVFVDAGAHLDGFFSDTGIAFAQGRPPADQVQRFDTARRSMDAGHARLREGQRASAVWQAMQDAVTDPLLTAQAHGLGISIREWPFFGPATAKMIGDGALSVERDTVLRPGMVVNLEVGGHAPDGSSVQIEQTFVVGEDAATTITEQGRDTPWAVGT